MNSAGSGIPVIVHLILGNYGDVVDGALLS